MSRDPRHDPKPGDVLRKPGMQFLVSKVTATRINFYCCCCQASDYFSASSWREWAKDAEVLHASE